MVQMSAPHICIKSLLLVEFTVIHYMISVPVCSGPTAVELSENCKPLMVMNLRQNRTLSLFQPLSLQTNMWCHHTS